MKNMIENILISLETGDALGAPLSGMSRGHIKNHFPRIETYVDAAPALKGKEERWIMPGLYTSITQMCLIACLLTNRRGLSPGLFLKTIRSTPASTENDFGIFRNPDRSEGSMITGMGESENISGARILFPSLALALYIRKRDALLRAVLDFMASITADTEAITGSALICDLIFSALSNTALEKDSIIPGARETVEFLRTFCKKNPGCIFDLKINPDYIDTALENYENIIHRLHIIQSLHECEEMICGEVNKTLKTPVTRATVNNPLALIPFALFIATKKNADSSNILPVAASMGGETSTLAALTGIFAALDGRNDHLTGILQGDIINRKRLMSLNGLIASGKEGKAYLDDFIDGEKSLTAKYLSEKNSRMKHRKKTTEKKKKKPQKQASREEILSRHVVESWTKVDQAKWRRESRKNEKE